MDQAEQEQQQGTSWEGEYNAECTAGLLGKGLDHRRDPRRDVDTGVSAHLAFKCARTGSWPDRDISLV